MLRYCLGVASQQALALETAAHAAVHVLYPVSSEFDSALPSPMKKSLASGDLFIGAGEENVAELKLLDPG